MENDGYDISPSSLTSMAVQQVIHKRAPAPYSSNCTSNWSSSAYTKYVHIIIRKDLLNTAFSITCYVPEGWVYSMQLCQRFCVHSSVVEQCGCVHPIFMDSRVGSENIPACNLTDTCKCSILIIELLK